MVQRPGQKRCQITDDKGTIAPLPMGEKEADKEISTVYKVTCLGAELMVLCVGLARLNLF